MTFGKGTLNKVMLVGRLGKDPELKYTPSGTAVVNFSIATNMVWKDQDGNQKEKTEWHRIVAWRKAAEFVGEYLKKGMRVYVEGRIETRSWQDQNNVTRYTTEIIADNIQFMDSRGERTTTSAEPPPPQEPEFESPGPEEADDLPF